MFKFSLGSFGAFLIFANLAHVVSRKRLILERNRSKFERQEYVSSLYKVLLTVKCSFWGSFGAFPVFDDLVSTLT